MSVLGLLSISVDPEPPDEADAFVGAAEEVVGGAELAVEEVTFKSSLPLMLGVELGVELGVAVVVGAAVEVEEGLEEAAREEQLGGSLVPGAHWRVPSLIPLQTSASDMDIPLNSKA